MISELKADIAAKPIMDSGQELVSLADSGMLLDPKYFEWQYSKDPEMKLREDALKNLLKARDILRERVGNALWNFKIWDCFRTLETQRLLFDAYAQDLRKAHPEWSDDAIEDAVQVFVSFPSFDPDRPAPHNTGGAVDLTIVDENGEELDMGTEFDEFVEKAHTDFFDDSQVEAEIEIHKNRMLLKEVMEEAGFVNYSQEWWHFSYGDQFWAYANEKAHAIYGSKEI